MPLAQPNIREASDNGTPITILQPDSRQALVYNDIAERLIGKLDAIEAGESSSPQGDLGGARPAPTFSEE